MMLSVTLVSVLATMKKMLVRMATVIVRVDGENNIEYCRDLNNYLYYFGGSFLYLYYNGPQNTLLVIKAPIL